MPVALLGGVLSMIDMGRLSQEVTPRGNGVHLRAYRDP